MGLQLKNRDAVISGVREQARIEGAAGTSIAESVDRTASIGANVVLPEAIAIGAQQHEQSLSRRYAGAVLPPPVRARQIALAAEIGATTGDYGAAIAADKAESAARERGASHSDVSTERREAADTTRQYANAIRAASERKHQGRG